jgi:dynein heavy chain
MPTPREYSGMTYDGRESRLVVFGGWNNGWLDDMYSLNIAKIVGPSYAITSAEPALGQLSGKSKLVIRGQGFKEPNIKVIFTNGNRPVDTFSAKTSKEVSAEFISATEITCLTPSFDDFGPVECVMQVSIAGGDYTTTWIPFHYFLNTRALKSLAYGPGVLGNVLVGQPVEFVIQARNDLNENRVSGNDEWEVNIVNPADKKQKIEHTNVDRGDGSYLLTYQVEEPGEYEIEINFLNDKQVMVPIRGSPYKASFGDDGKATDNSLTGGVMAK